MGLNQITKEYAKENDLKQIGKINDTDMSKIILKLERLEENKEIKYYCMDFIVYDDVKDKANIEVSLWGDKPELFNTENN